MPKPLLNKSHYPHFRRKLREWFRTARRELPWRNTADPYAIWVSEVMLQQTQVSTVIPYFEAFLRRFPTVQALAEADLSRVLKVWEGLGYYARARNLHRAARRVVSEWGGRIPEQYSQFRKLPGVGEYIAAAVMSIAFDQPRAVVDGNVRRVLARLLGMEAPVNDPRAAKAYRVAAEALLDREHPAAFNQAMMELGALVCRPRNPRCGECPVQRFCTAFAAGQQEYFPRRLPRRQIPEYPIAVGVVQRNGRLLITRRAEAGLLGGLWEFPGGKVREGESPEQACVREIAEEVNLQVRIRSHLTRVRHAYSHFRILMDVFLCEYQGGEVRLNGPVEYRWIAPEEIDAFAFPGANRKFIPLLRR
ncbi:MAG: A/G-specific adenine glycosylase, partial [Calditrichaeota bacterium]